jgi:hypothetical protein
MFLISNPEIRITSNKNKQNETIKSNKSFKKILHKIIFKAKT